MYQYVNGYMGDIFQTPFAPPMLFTTLICDLGLWILDTAESTIPWFVVSRTSTSVLQHLKGHIRQLHVTCVYM